MKLQQSIILLLLSPFFTCTGTSSNSNSLFSQDAIIAHPEIGLFLDYIGLYTPAETVIHNSAIFPMTTATCYFLPLSAAVKIPSCNITSKKYKRFIPALIGVGAGVFFTGMSVMNLIQANNLQKEVAIVENALVQFSERTQLHGAHIARINSNQIMTGEQLKMLQNSLEAMMPFIKGQSDVLNHLVEGFERLHRQLRHSFLYSSITNIFRNELNLQFLESHDLQEVVYDIIGRGNLKFNYYYGSIPLVQIITKLLIRQQIDFVPSAHYKTENPKEIGRLVITSFFAIPPQKQTPFHIYKLLPIPFFHNNETIQISAIPKYWGINPTNNDTIEWYEPGEFGCHLQSMTSCRSTPPIRKLTNDTCFGQIIGKHPQSECYTKLAPVFSFFLHQLRDNIWITSSYEPLNCIEMPESVYPIKEQQMWNLNKHVFLPPVALVNVTPGYTIACPGFTLVGSPIVSNVSSFKIMYNDHLFTKNISIMNIYEHLSKNSTWLNRKPLQLKTDDTINHLQRPVELPNFRTFQGKHIGLFGMLIISCIFLGIIASLVCYYIYRRKQSNSVQYI